MNACANRAAPAPISVVVCTRDRPALLECCLDSLARVQYPAIEVLVIDNGSRDSQAADATLARGFRYVRECRPGLNWAAASVGVPTS
jgi:glycosyltransferase involved in cell wall biosynthesis